MKLRTEEILGAWYLARAFGWSEGSEYRIAEENADMDVEIRNVQELHRLQLTTSGPVWPEGSKDWGSDHKLQMEQLRKTGRSSGWGPFKRLSSGEIVNNESAISRSDLEKALGDGLQEALKKKADHRSANLELVVTAFDCYILEPEIFKCLAEQALRRVPILGFACVHFVTMEASVYHRSG